MCAYKSLERPASLFKKFYNKPFDDLSFSNFKYIINRFRTAVYIHLSGGEPFLNENIFEMIEYAYQNKCVTTAFSNGNVLGDKIDSIINSNLPILVISLDAYNSNGYNTMRGGSKQVFREVIENITELVEKRKRFDKDLIFRLGYICTKKNYRGMPKMVKFTEDLGVDQLSLSNLTPYGIPGFLEDQCLYEDDLDVLETIKSMESPNKQLKIDLPRLYKREIVERRCKDPFMTMKIDGNGNVAPCCRFPQRRELGNVFLDREVWNNGAFQRLRRTLIDESLHLSKLCKTCDKMV
jgi:radical SAM protein with 4Fe4S-binding SPASM domain